MFKSTRLIGLLGFCLLNLTFTVNALSLYEAEVPYKTFCGITPNPTSPAVLDAFKEVLIKVSGTETILATSEVQQTAKEMDQYVNQFSFPQAPAGAERFVRIHFNETLINKLLAMTKHPIMEKKRALTLVWLVVEHDKMPKWVGGGSELALQQKVEAAFVRRGMPVVFPLFDLAETSVISEKNVWEGAIEPLASSAARYNAGAVLVGKVSGEQGACQSHWTLYSNGEVSSWDMAENEVDLLLNKTLEQLNTKLKANTSPVGIVSVEEDKVIAPIQGITLVVSGIHNMEQHAKIEAYLRALPAIKEVEVAQISPQQTIFKIRAAVQFEAIATAISGDSLLIEDGPQLSGTEKKLLYKVADIAL